MAGHLGTLKDGNEIIFPGGFPGSADARLLDRINVRHQSIAFRIAVEAFLLRQLRSWRHGSSLAPLKGGVSVVSRRWPSYAVVLARQDAFRHERA